MKTFFISAAVLFSVPLAGLFLLDTYYTQLPSDHLIEGMVGQPRHIHPLRAGNNPIDKELLPLIYRSLLSTTPTGELGGDLAESWQVSEDGLTYTVQLKEGQYWHDGKSITSDDVLFTLQKLEAFRDVTLNKVSAREFTCVLPEIFAPFPELLTTPIAPSHIPLDSPPLTVVGNGAFRLAAFDPAPNFIQSITLERVTPRTESGINRLMIRFYNDREELRTGLQMGEIQAYSGESQPWPGYYSVTAPQSNVVYAVYLNLQRGGLLNDIDFRHALATATPKEHLVNDVLGGRYRVADGPIPDSWATEADIAHYPFEEPTSPVYEGEFTLVYPKTDDNAAAAAALKEAWDKLGIVVSLKSVEADDIENVVLHDRAYDFLLLAQEVGKDPDRYSFWHSTQTSFPGLNITGYKQVRVDKALEKGRKTLDQAERKEHYSLFQKLLTSDSPAIFLYQPLYTYTVSHRIKHFSLPESMAAPSERYRGIDEWVVGW